MVPSEQGVFAQAAFMLDRAASMLDKAVSMLDKAMIAWRRPVGPERKRCAASHAGDLQEAMAP